MDDPLVRRSRSAHPRRRARSAAKPEVESTSQAGYASRLRSRVLATVSASLSPADEEYLQQVRSRESYAAEYQELRAAGGWSLPPRRRRAPPHSAHGGRTPSQSIPRELGRGVSARAAPSGGPRGSYEREMVGTGPTLELPSTSHPLSPMPSLCSTGDDFIHPVDEGQAEGDGAAKRPVRRSPRPRTAHPSPSCRWASAGAHTLGHGSGRVRQRASDDSALNAGAAQRHAGLLSDSEGEGVRAPRAPLGSTGGGSGAVRRRAHAQALSQELDAAATRARVALEDVGPGRPATADLTGTSVRYGHSGTESLRTGAAESGPECLDEAADGVVEEVCAAVESACPEHAALLRRVWREHVVPSRADAAALARALHTAGPASARRGETGRALDRVVARSGERVLHSWQSFSARMLDKSSTAASLAPAATTATATATTPYLRSRPQALRSALVSPARSTASSSRPVSTTASLARSREGRTPSSTHHTGHAPSRGRQPLPVAVGQHARLLLLSILRLRHVMFGEVTQWAREAPWPLNVASEEEGEGKGKGGLTGTAAADAARLWEHVSAAGLHVAGPGAGREPHRGTGVRAHRGSLRSVFAHTALLAQEGELWRRSHSGSGHGVGGGSGSSSGGGGGEGGGEGGTPPLVAFRPPASAEATDRALAHSRESVTPRRAAELQLLEVRRVRRAQAVARGWLARRAALRLRFARLTQLDPRALWREASEAQHWAASQGGSTPSTRATAARDGHSGSPGHGTAPTGGNSRSVGREALVWQLLWECQRLARDLAARWWRTHAEAERRRVAWAEARQRALTGPLLDAVSALSDDAHELARRVTQNRRRTHSPREETPAPAVTTATAALNRAASAQAALASALEAMPDPDAAVSCGVQTDPAPVASPPSTARSPSPRLGRRGSSGSDKGSLLVADTAQRRGARPGRSSHGEKAGHSDKGDASGPSPRVGGDRWGSGSSGDEGEFSETRIARVRSRRLQEAESENEDEDEENEGEDEFEDTLEPSVLDAGLEGSEQSSSGAERGGRAADPGAHRRGMLRRQPSSVIRERRRVRPGFGDQAMLLSAARRKLFTRAAFRRGVGAVLPYHMLPLFRKLKPSYRAREVPPSTLLPLLEHAYTSKLDQDGVADRALAPRRTFPEFLFDQFTRKYGLRALAEARLVDVASSVKRLWPQQGLPSDTVPLFALLMGLLPPTSASAAPPRPPADPTASFRRAIALEGAHTPTGPDGGGAGAAETGHKRSRPRPLGDPCRPPLSAGALAFLLRQRAATEEVCEFELSLLRRRAQEEEGGTPATAGSAPPSPTPPLAAGAAGDARAGAVEGHVDSVGMQSLLMSEGKAMRLVSGTSSSPPLSLAPPSLPRSPRHCRSARRCSTSWAFPGWRTPRLGRSRAPQPVTAPPL